MAVVAVAVGVAALAAAGGACSSTTNTGAGVSVTVATPVRSSPAAGSSPSTGGSTAAATATPVPPPELVLSTTQVYQAGAVLVSVTGAVKDGSATFLGRTYPLTQGTRSMFTFVGVDTDDPTGAQTLTVQFTQPTGSKGTLTGTITVLQTQWTVDSLQFDSTTSQLLDPTIVNNEYALLRSIYSTVTPEKYWDGGFILPADGPLTARYGEQRSINGGPPSGHHGGTDIGVDEGTPVKATAAGKVVLARQLQVRGNMVIIDHGGGLYSGYAHLSAFDVSEGQMVKQGDVIGLSGKTGLVTGPHLHWEMAIDGVWLDALRFTDGSNGF
jgi:murein DD-endopeptidase MepM/ murein hydrolase activator NlpD